MTDRRAFTPGELRGMGVGLALMAVGQTFAVAAQSLSLSSADDSARYSASFRSCG